MHSLAMFLMFGCGSEGNKQVDQDAGDGSQAHIIELASGWMAANADHVDEWIHSAMASLAAGDAPDAVFAAGGPGGGAGGRARR